MEDTLKISHLSAFASTKQILFDVNLTIHAGEIHALMGPNGAGKTSLAMVLAGQPNIKIKDQRSLRFLRFRLGQVRLGQAKIKINGKEISKLTPNQRVKAGLFVSFQKPIEIPGVTIRNLLRTAVAVDFEQRLKDAQKDLKIGDEFITRSFENFSGGENRKLELLQAKVLAPRFLVLDEIDSGLDIDCLSVIAKNIYDMAYGKDRCGILLITHSPRVLKYIKPGHLHVMIKGRIVRSDGLKLLEKIEKEGYQWLT
jgi:Fe-S cluster assembly ATP-binding protein